MKSSDHDPMLDELREALAPPPAEPSPAELSALRRAVAARFSPPAGRNRAGSWTWWRPVRVLAVAVVLTFTGTAVAVSTGMPLPAVRSLARALGLPVDSPSLAGAKVAMRGLRAALDKHDANEGQSVAALLRDRLNTLEASDRSSIASEADALLAESDQFLAAEALQARKRLARKIAPSGQAAGDDEDPSDDTADMDSEEIDPEAEDEDNGPEEPGAAAERPDEDDRRGHRARDREEPEEDNDPSPDEDEDDEEN